MERKSAKQPRAKRARKTARPKLRRRKKAAKTPAPKRASDTGQREAHGSGEMTPAPRGTGKRKGRSPSPRPRLRTA